MRPDLRCAGACPPQTPRRTPVPRPPQPPPTPQVQTTPNPPSPGSMASPRSTSTPPRKPAAASRHKRWRHRSTATRPWRRPS
ncbi:MAG: hypothetical protein B7Y03_11585 [Polaromonas sp. 24-62-144]|nr:MAG: hypothetical protein B7Y03_11585 [Polaromonas sp. 24-62-144]